MVAVRGGGAWAEGRCQRRLGVVINHRPAAAPDRRRRRRLMARHGTSTPAPAIAINTATSPCSCSLPITATPTTTTVVAGLPADDRGQEALRLRLLAGLQRALQVDVRVLALLRRPAAALGHDVEVKAHLADREARVDGKKRGRGVS